MWASGRLKIMLKKMAKILTMPKRQIKKIRIQKHPLGLHQETTIKITQVMTKKLTWIVKARLKGMRIPISIMFPAVVITIQLPTISSGFVQKKKRRSKDTESQRGKIIFL